MSATRTQVYLTADQREQLDRLIRRDGKTLAQLIREAVDAYLEDTAADPEPGLEATFGSMPALEVPSRDEWNRG